jgi:hypothetical protein
LMPKKDLETRRISRIGSLILPSPPGAPMTAIVSYPRLCLQDQRELTH